ncbi:hypothetical protein BG258_11115 [Lysinibacillus fusiformis]|uniref:DUF1259 domain-containing protein n=2 Tax=Bacillaceae TaxID=186817 RepID=A0A1E4R7F0_9BACI|nr:hypothetical protein BG258_11115 [Lysinibacillus fusiformis]HBJ01937.1 DUF1259 domain-containing protein [Lysinibacillus sp.]
MAAMKELQRRGLIVTAVHNHWLFDNPRLMYMHWRTLGIQQILQEEVLMLLLQQAYSKSKRDTILNLDEVYWCINNEAQ